MRTEMHLSTVGGGYAVGEGMDMLLVTEGRSILLPSDRVVCASSRRDEVARCLSSGRKRKNVLGGGWNK